jgi:hypothetical protein
MTVFVDFDGTLHRSDLLLEQLARLLPRKPWLLPNLLWILLRQGKSGFKAAVATHVPAHGIQLPWNEEVVQFVRDVGRQGEVIILTAGDEKAVQSAIRQRSDGWRVVGSHEAANLKGETKAPTPA